MTLIRGVEFSDEVAPFVTDLIDRLIASHGASHWFHAHNEVKFALVPPANGKQTFRHIMRIIPKGNAAIVRRSRIPKQNPTEFKLPDTPINDVARTAEAWYQEVKDFKIPRGYQGTGSISCSPVVRLNRITQSSKES